MLAKLYTIIVSPALLVPRIVSCLGAVLIGIAIKGLLDRAKNPFDPAELRP